MVPPFWRYAFIPSKISCPWWKTDADGGRKRGWEGLDPSVVPSTLFVPAQGDHVNREHLTELGGGNNRSALFIRQRVLVWTDLEVDHGYCPHPVSRVDRSANPISPSRDPQRRSDRRGTRLPYRPPCSMAISASSSRGVENSNTSLIGGRQPESDS